MSKKDELWWIMNKAKQEVADKKHQLEEAQDNYREELVEESVEAILSILNEENTLNERDLKLVLSDLALRTKQIYS